MDLTNDFEVAVGVDEAWIVLNDVERIAPCLPGAQLTEIDGDEFRGVVKIKVGPITAQYKGAAKFVEQNEAERRVVLKADGRDTRGAGNASALVTATLESVDAARTKVNVTTDLTVTGKVAQFGRGVMADVSAKLMGQFATNLEEMLENEPAAAASGAAASDGPITSGDIASAMANAASTVTTDTGTVRKINSPEVEAVDLLDAAGAPVLKRIAPVAGVLALLLLLRRILRKS